uniref:GCP_C_terminal domain-containing protein n=1 Tax=Gongylonema pulchrum TaxID=637853 RepID=A0A183DCP2_9BILA
LTFWSVVVARVLYADFYGRSSEPPSALCSGVQTLDSWLPLGLAKAVSCDKNRNIDSFFGRISREAEVVTAFLAAQFSFVTTYYDWLITAADDLYEEWLSERLQSFNEHFLDFYEIVQTSFCDLRETCFGVFVQVYFDTKDFISNVYEYVAHNLGFRIVDNKEEL